MGSMSETFEGMALGFLKNTIQTNISTGHIIDILFHGLHSNLKETFNQSLSTEDEILFSVTCADEASEQGQKVVIVLI